MAASVTTGSTSALGSERMPQIESLCGASVEKIGM